MGKWAVKGMDIMTILLLLAGGIVLPLAGWLIGIVKLWKSDTWRFRDKLIGTLVVPGGLMAPVAVAGTGNTSLVTCSEHGGPGIVTAMTCTGGGNTTTELTLAVTLAAGALLSAAWLYLMARRIPRAGKV